MSRRTLGVTAALAGGAAIAASFLPWWRLPSEPVFGLGIPGYEVAGIERWHGWAAGAAGISLLILGGAVAARPNDTRSVAALGAGIGLGLVVVVAVGLLGAGMAVRPGPGALLAAGAGVLGGVASAAATRALPVRDQGWPTRSGG